jgi:glutamine cyclotransferase
VPLEEPAEELTVVGGNYHLHTVMALERGVVMEFIEGEIFANVWHTDKIVRINPKDGNVVGVIELAGIDAKEKRRDPEHVLNGIAYDIKTGEMFVTGKCWPKIYQIRLVPQK